MQLAAPPPGTPHLPAYTVPMCSKKAFEKSTGRGVIYPKKAVLLTCLSHESRGDNGQRMKGWALRYKGRHGAPMELWGW